MSDTLRNRLHAFLRHTERYTRTDMVYLASGGFWLILKTVLAAAIAFGVSLAFANLLPPTTFGTYKYVFSVFGLLALPTLMGMSTSIMRSVAQGYDGTIIETLRTKIRWGVLGSIASVGVALYYFLRGNVELASAFGLVSIFLPFVDTFSIFNALLNGKRLFKASARYELVVQSISGSAIVLTMLATDTLWHILTVYFVVNTAARYVTLRVVTKKYLANKAVDPEAIRYGKHLSAMSVLSTLAETLDNILLWQFVGAVPLAIYSFARAIPLQISANLKKISLLAFPKFVQRDLATIKTHLPFRLGVLFLFLAVITGVYIVAAPALFSFFFPQYVDAVFYTQLYALTLLLFPKKLIGTALNAHGRTQELYINSFATPVVKLTLAISLIPTLGILGAVISELVAQCLSLVLLSTLLYRTKA